MNWYLAKFVYRIICGNGHHQPQFDEQLRLIFAGNKQEAFQKASAYGKREEESFYNQKQQLVQWQFINISELYLLNDLTDGAELYSRIQERENADSYIYAVHKKAENIFLENHKQPVSSFQLV